MRLLFAMLLAMTALSCGEREETKFCTNRDECRKTEVCTRDGVCRLKLGEACLAHGDCESSVCSSGYCRLNFN